MSEKGSESRTEHFDESSSQEHISMDAEQWEAFTAMLNSPAQDRPRLKKLLTERSVLEG